MQNMQKISSKYAKYAHVCVFAYYAYIHTLLM